MFHSLIIVYKNIFLKLWVLYKKSWSAAVTLTNRMYLGIVWAPPVSRLVRLGNICLTLGDSCSLGLKLCTSSERRHLQKNVTQFLYTALSLEGGGVSSVYHTTKSADKVLGTRGKKTSGCFSTSKFFFELSIHNSLCLVIIGSGCQQRYKKHTSKVIL